MSWDKIIEPKGSGGIWFCDFRLFNQALLARQSWRFLTNLNSLCSRVLKAKYYPNGSLVDTVFAGNHPSTWHAIHHGLAMLNKGIIWRIDNGEHAHIWRDPRLPQPPSYRPISLRGTCCLHCVSDHMDESGCWNQELLLCHFLTPVVHEILQIKPSPQRLEDASPGGKALWGCPAPPKVRIFAWRLASNTLATRENKVKHHIEKSDICLLCGVECEDTFRTFTTCSLARGIWKAMGEEWCMPRLENVVNTGTDWCCTSWILVVKRSGYQS